MRVLVLGHGKTGRLVTEVAAEHGHSVHVLDAKENPQARALTAPFVAGFDVVIDFTQAEAAVQNMRACLAMGARMVVGTTGWYDRLADMRSLAERKDAGLLYGANFSVGVQALLRVAAELGRELGAAGYRFRIEETHHATKLDQPSGTAMTLRDTVSRAAGKAEVPVESRREGEAMGLHVLMAESDADRITLSHEAFSRRGFAEGAVRAAEWMAGRTGVFAFEDVFTELDSKKEGQA